MESSRLFLLAILFLLPIVSCTNRNQGENNNKEPLPFLVTVLCDVSTSVDSTMYKKRLERMSDSCSSILRQYPPNSLINLQLISGNIRQEPFLKVIIEKLKKKTAVMQKRRLREKDSIIYTHIFEASKDSEAKHRTCILTSMESAYRSFKAITGNNPGHYQGCILIILSDMIEYCPISPMGDIQMSDKLDHVRVRKDDTSKINNYKTDINFDRANIKVIVRIFTPGMEAKEAILIDEIWKSIFAKYHYSAANTNEQLFN